jgi:hypothetical protein
MMQNPFLLAQQKEALQYRLELLKRLQNLPSFFAEKKRAPFWRPFKKLLY